MGNVDRNMLILQKPYLGPCSKSLDSWQLYGPSQGGTHKPGCTTRKVARGQAQCLLTSPNQLPAKDTDKQLGAVPGDHHHQSLKG